MEEQCMSPGVPAQCLRGRDSEPPGLAVGRFQIL